MIRDLWLLNRLQANLIKNALIKRFALYPWSTLVLFTAGFGFFGGYLRLTYLLANFIYGQEIYGPFLAFKLLQILLVIALGIALMSSLNIAISQLFLSKDLEFQFSLPVRFHGWMLHRYGQIFWQSSWMLVLFGGPFVLYYLYLAGSPVWTQLAGLCVFLVVCTFPVTLAAMVCMVLVKGFPAKRVHQVFLVVTLLFVVVLILLFRFLKPEEFIGPGKMEAFRGFVDLVTLDRQTWNPAVWASHVLAAMGSGSVRGLLAPGAKLAGLFLGSIGLFLFLASRLYRSTWDRALQSLSGEGYLDLNGARESLLSRGLSRPRWTQICREILLFFRDPSQWSQIFVLAALLGLYLFSLAKIPSEPFGENLYVAALVNSGFTAFVSLSLASRFVFTAFSGDGQAIWLMKTAPDGWARFTRGKLWVFGLPTVGFGLLLNLGSGMVLDLSAAELLVLGLHCLWDTLLIVLLALALGMLFINPEIENPLKLIVSPGGFLLMAMGAFFTFVHVVFRLTEASPRLNEFLLLIGWPNLQDGGALWFYLGFLALETLLVVWLLKKGIAHLRSGDYL